MDKGKLKKLNQLVARLAVLPENEWMADDLLKQISMRTEVSDGNVHPILLNIHEQCVEDVIRQQAEEFYKDFALHSIREQLINYMIKMEHERRRGDFEGFCLAMFQQLECVGNYAFNQKRCRRRLAELKEEAAFGYSDKETGQWKTDSSGHMLIAVLMNRFDKPSKTYQLSTADLSKYFDERGMPIVDYQQGKSQWNILSKIKAFLYFFYFNEEMNSYKFFDFKGILDELYAVRNKVHPEIKLNDKTKKALEHIEANKSYSMAKFYGFLGKVFSNLSQERLQQYANEQEVVKPIAYKNDLGLVDGRAPKLGDEEKLIISLDAFRKKGKNT